MNTINETTLDEQRVAETMQKLYDDTVNTSKYILQIRMNVELLKFILDKSRSYEGLSIERDESGYPESASLNGIDITFAFSDDLYYTNIIRTDTLK